MRHLTRSPSFDLSPSSGSGGGSGAGGGGWSSAGATPGTNGTVKIIKLRRGYGLFSVVKPSRISRASGLSSLL